jgi:hypothetical protein
MAGSKRKRNWNEEPRGLQRCAMYSHRWTLALLLMVLYAMQSTSSSAEPRIGVAASTRPNAEGIVGANSQPLSAGSELYTNETVRTGNRGAADLVFIDNSNLSVGPSSEVLLDKFDPIGSSGIVVSQATRGTFRISTGSHDHRVNTPYGTLGLLGTHGQVRSLVGQDALGYAALDPKPGETVTLSAKQSVVEVVLKPQGETRKLCRDGRPPQYGKPCPEDCEVIIRLAEGEGATYRHKSGKVANLTTANSAACFTQTGQMVLFTSSESILSFSPGGQTPPGGGGSTPTPPGGGITPPTIPIIPCISSTQPGCSG